MAKKIDIGGELHSVATDHKVADASEIKDISKGNKSQAAFNSDVDRHEVDIHGTGGINDRLDDLEAMEQIVIDGGEAQIATGNDFTNPDATKRAKIPTVGAIVDGLNDGIYNVSKRFPTGGPNSDGKFTLDYILNNANTLIPTSWQHGGMIISFVDSSDNKYVQARWMADSFTTDVTQWQGVDEEPIGESDNLVKSGGVLNSIVSTDIGMSLRGGNTGEGGQAAYIAFNALPAGDYYLVINSANDLQNIFVGLATGVGGQYVTQRLIDDKPITAGNHYFKVTLAGNEVDIKISIAWDQNITPAGITWSINESKTNSLNIAETSGSDKNKSVIALRENTRSSSTPEYKTISSVNIGAASKTKAGVMTADDRINQLNVVEYTIDTDIAVSSDSQYITPALETLKGEGVTAFELEIIEKTFIANTYSCLGVAIDGSFYSLDVGYSNKLFFFGNGNQNNFRLFVRANVITTEGHFKAKLRVYQKSNIESLIFSYDLLSIDGLDNKNVIISPIIYSFGSPYAKFKIEILENTIGLVSGREKQYLSTFLGGSTYELITLDDNNSKIVECSNGTPAFCIVLRSNSANSTGRLVFTINLNVESYEKEQNINNAIIDIETNVNDVIDIIDEKLLVGGETANEFNYLKAQHINIGFDLSQSKLSDSFDTKFLFLIPLKENIDSTKYYVWNRFDGEEQGSYFDDINFFATKTPAAVGADVIRGTYGGDFLRGFLYNFDSEYKYLYLGFWCKLSFHDYDAAIERVYAILRKLCFKEDTSIQYFSSYVDYYKDKYVKDDQGIENAGKVLGVNNAGQVVPTDKQNIYQLGGVPASQGAENAGKTLIIDDGGNVVPGTVTPQGVITGMVQYHQTEKIYLGADLLAGSQVVLGTGWTGNLAEGFTHTPENTADLEIQYPTEVGQNYVIGLSLGSNQTDSLYVAIGNSNKVSAYNGTTVANIGIKSEGGYLIITPSSGYNSTVLVTLKKVVPQADADSELVLDSRNVNHGNTTDNITGFWNIAIGADTTLRKNQNGSRNIALGYNALANFTSGTRNIGIGTFAMSQLVSGNHNVAIGSDSLWFIKRAFDNIAIGYGAFWQMPQGAEFDAIRNIAIGTDTMSGAQVSSYDNIAIGYASGTRSTSIISPQKNVAIGNNAGRWAKKESVAVGYNAGYFSNGEKNIAIGCDAGAVNNTVQDNSIAIGYGVKTTKSNQVVIGNSSHTEFVFGTKKLVFNNDNTITWEAIS